MVPATDNSGSFTANKYLTNQSDVTLNTERSPNLCSMQIPAKGMAFVLLSCSMLAASSHNEDRHFNKVIFGFATYLTFIYANLLSLYANITST